MGARSLEPIAIVGMGCRPDDFFALLAGGRCAIGEIPPDRWAITGFDDPAGPGVGRGTGMSR